jgi:hypothetical protein
MTEMVSSSFKMNLNLLINKLQGKILPEADQEKRE